MLSRLDGSRLRRPRLYATADDPDPLQAYGETKLAGERAVGEADGSEALVLRLSFLWGVDRSTGGLAGFPTWSPRSSGRVGRFRGSPTGG